MLLSIVVLSYNRPEQIERILKKIVGVVSSNFNIIIKDDCSPKISEIESVYLKYKSKINVNLILHKNDSNMGYDRNLITAFDITDADYVFLLSDDDYVDGEKIDNLISCLIATRKDIYYTPYSCEGKINRDSLNVETNKVLLPDFSSVIYNSILFSGLVFNRSAVLELDLDRDFLANSIYTQVYIATLLIYNCRSYGTLPNDVLYLGGDGDNYFGKNEAAKNSSLLSDRTKLTSNLNYQPFLLLTIKKVASVTDNRIYSVFIKEYKKRLISYGLRSRHCGYKEHSDFLFKYVNSDLPFFLIPFLSFLMLFLVPKKVAGLINDMGIKIVRKSG